MEGHGDKASSLTDGKKYEIERITEKQMYNGETLYQIKWRDYSEDQNTWEPLENYPDAIPLIREFEIKQNAMRRGKCNNNVSFSTDSKQCEVEQIVAKKTHNGETLYQIKWQGYSEDQNTWERLEQYPEAIPSIHEFETKQRFDDNAGTSTDNRKSTVEHMYKNNENALKVDTRRGEDASSHADTISTSLMSVFEGRQELTKYLDRSNENVLKLENHHDEHSPSHVDFSTTNCLINNAMGNIVISEKQNVSNARELVPSTIASNLELEEHLSKYCGEDIEIIGLGFEGIKDGIEVGIRIKDDNNAIYRLDSREVTRRWPQLYLSYLEHHIVFF